MSKERIDVGGNTYGPYSPGVKSNGLIWLAGQIAPEAGEDIKSQTRASLKKIDDLLHAERPEDKGNGLYEVYNRVQESLVKGKYMYASSGKVNVEGTKIRKGREIKNFKQSIDVNKKLSELAFELV